MPTFSHTDLRSFTRSIFQAAGAPPCEAEIVSDHLVDANLAGHDSHGVIRAVAYTRGMMKGVVPYSEYEIVKDTPISRIVNARDGLGIVAALKATEWAIEKAKVTGFGAVGVHRNGHTGRLGDYPPRAAEQGLVGLCLLNGGGRFVAPFGGTGRCLPPNPISFAAPRANGEPVLVDMTMSVVAGGKIDVAKARGEDLPEGWMIDGEGNSVTDPDRFYQQGGAVLPLGGMQFGHKGYGLGFLVDILAGGLTWAGCSNDKPTRGANGFLSIAINIEHFIPLAEFQAEVEKLIAWAKSGPKLPGVAEIHIPGEPERKAREDRTANGIDIEDTTWTALSEMAGELGLPSPEPLSL